MIALFLPLLSSSLQAVPTYGPYEVTKQEETVGGFIKGSQKASFFYPSNGSAAERFPLISFSHGDFGGGVDLLAYTELLRQIASHGLVVGAHESCNPTCGDEQYLDQLHLLEWATKTATPQHPVLHLVNFSAGFGVSGHSTGGRSTLQSAAIAQQHSIKAGVAIHPDPKVDSAKNITYCPMAVFTGTADHIEPKGSAYADFQACPTPKVFANMIGASHLEPIMRNTRWGVWTAAWFRVYLTVGSAEWNRYHSLIFNNSTKDSVCGGTNPMEQCILNP